MNIYYEINEGLAAGKFGGIINWFQRDVRETVIYSSRAMIYSDRVWEETNNGIRYIKHRFDNPAPTVDKEEFMWIKIKSKELMK